VVSTRSSPSSAAERGQFGFVEIGQHQFGAPVAQPAGDLGPDSPGATGDEDNFALQRHHGRNVPPRRSEVDRRN
jgi:hypothetical protein